MFVGSCGALEPVSPPDGSEDLETRPTPKDLAGRVPPLGLAVMLLAAAMLRLALLLRAEEAAAVEAVSTVLPPDSPATVLATSLDLLDLRLEAFGTSLDFSDSAATALVTSSGLLDLRLGAFGA